MSASPKISLIISVYNNFKWLRLILESLKFQTLKDFEVIIADDGSSEENVNLIKEYIHKNMGKGPVIKHVWHEDKGWRKNIALNNAVRNSAGEYLVFIDGDCVPHPKFIEDHYRLRRKGAVTGGRRIESELYLNELMEGFNPLPKDFFKIIRVSVLKHFFSQSFSKTLALLRRTLRFGFIFGHPVGLKNQGILGANFGLYRSDFDLVNGFDERYLAPGTGEDCDIDLRLENAGVKHKKTSHYALMIHKCHNRLDWTSKENADLFQKAKNDKLTYTPFGLYQ